MMLNLTEGQTFAVKYELLRRLSQHDAVECWLAADTETEEKVFLKIFDNSLSPENKSSIQDAVQKQKDLQHSFIVRNLHFSDQDTCSFISAPYVKDVEAYTQQGPFKQQWRILRQVGKTLEFAHSVGFAHGHLHLNNILVNSEGNVYLTDFGVALSRNAEQENYFSPQVKDKQSPLPRDDIFSFGQLIFTALNGKPWIEGEVTNLNPEFSELLQAMLHTSPSERPTGLAKVIEAIDKFVSEEEGPQGLKATAPISSDHRLPREQKTVSSTAVLTGFAVLASVAILVFILLPEATPTVSPTAAPIKSHAIKKPEVEEKKVLAPFEIAQLKKMEDEGTELATKLLRLQLEVEDVGGQIWASEKYNESVSIGISGDDAYRDKLYQQAFEQYQQGIALLESILTRVDSTYEENSVIGKEALMLGNSELAMKAFTIMNLIKPSDLDVISKLERAENLDKVQQFIRDGEIFEKNGDLTNALLAFKDAVNLDPLWSAGKTALSGLKVKIANQEFNEQMSLAFAALKGKSFDKAKAFFNKAQSILPKSSAPNDGLEQISIAKTQAEIQEYELNSEKHIRQEDWQSAVSEYETILSIEPGSTFASEGLKNAKRRITLNSKLVKFISQPDLMVMDDALENAKTVLLDAFKTSPSGPKLTDQVNQLSHLVSLARIPINVELVSDNKTDVTVYKIQSFGQIDSVTVPLYPGTYTFVGKRRGYRDIHKEITLHGGHAAPSIMISCVEKI